MSNQRTLIDLYPLYDYYMKEIDPRLGIYLLPDADELIVTEVMLLMGVEYKPSMNRLKAILYENLVTDISSYLYMQFTNMTFEILKQFNFEGINELIITPKKGFLLEVSYHTPMTKQEIEQYMKQSQYAAPG